MSTADQDAYLTKIAQVIEAIDHLAEAIRALRDIYAGSSVTGRWIDCDDEAVGHDPDQPEGGYYDKDSPPDGYYWEAYTSEEQTIWLESCASLAKAALDKIGVPLIEPPITEEGET